MTQHNNCYCFRANYALSNKIEPKQIPDWLIIDSNWQGYRITTNPWVVEVAKVLGILSVDHTADSWINYLESIGFREVIPVCCEDLYQDRLYF